MLETCTENEIDIISKLFLCCVDLKLVNPNWKDFIRKEGNSLISQHKLLQATVLHPLNLQYPIKAGYQQCFLKQIISQFEACGEEISDILYESYVEKLTVSNQQLYYYCHYKLSNEIYITLQESSSLVSEGTTGLSTWEGGLALAEWCLQHSSSFTGKSVLELGCGLGLTGLAVSALCQPLHYTFTDCHHRVLSLLDQNLKLNSSLLSKTKVSTHLLDWDHIQSSQLPNPVDIVLAADVVFDERLFPGLVNTLNYFLNIKSATTVLACTERNPNTLTAFLKCIVRRGIQVQELECPPPKTFYYSSSPPIRIFHCSNGGESSSLKTIGRCEHSYSKYWNYDEFENVTDQWHDNLKPASIIATRGNS